MAPNANVSERKEGYASKKNLAIAHVRCDLLPMAVQINHSVNMAEDAIIIKSSRRDRRDRPDAKK